MSPGTLHQKVSITNGKSKAVRVQPAFWKLVVPCSASYMRLQYMELLASDCFLPYCSVTQSCPTLCNPMEVFYLHYLKTSDIGRAEPHAGTSGWELGPLHPSPGDPHSVAPMCSISSATHSLQPRAGARPRPSHSAFLSRRSLIQVFSHATGTKFPYTAVSESTQYFLTLWGIFD